MRAAASPSHSSFFFFLTFVLLPFLAVWSQEKQVSPPHEYSPSAKSSLVLRVQYDGQGQNRARWSNLLVIHIPKKAVHFMQTYFTDNAAPKMDETRTRRHAHTCERRAQRHHDELLVTKLHCLTMSHMLCTILYCSISHTVCHLISHRKH